MLYAPRDLPPLATILADLGNPTPAAIATFLDVNPRTVTRWQRANNIPRAAAMALFWLTQWGRSIVDAQAVNDARLYAGLAQCHAQELAALRRELARVLTLAEFGSANGPSYAYAAACNGPAAEPATPMPGPASPARQSLRLVSRSMQRGC